MSQALVREAQKAESAKRHADAATIWEQLHELERAVQAYKLAGRLDRAAVCLERLGRPVDAAGMHSAAGNFARAAAIHAQLRDYLSAARAFLRAGQREQAAIMFEKGDAFEDAAKVYAVLGHVERAVQLYDAAGKPELAAPLRAKLTPKEAPRQDPLRAVEAMLRGDAVMDEDYVTRVVLHLASVDRTAEAAKVYAHCREDIGFPLITAASGKPQLEEKLAQVFLAAKDFHKAGQLFEQLGRFDQAGTLYAQSGDYERAAECFARAGDKAKAAEMFERVGHAQQAAELYLEAGEKERAAACYERAMDLGRAGKLYHELGRREQALQLLQKVPAEHVDFTEAARTVATILAATGHRTLAIKRYLQLLKGAKLEARTAPLYLHLGELLHLNGNTTQARTVYERLAAWDFGYADVRARLEALDRGAPAVATAAAPAPAEEEAAASEAPLVTMMEGFDVIKDTPLFRDLSLDEVRRFYDLAERKAYPQGGLIIEQDRPGAGLFVVRTGAVKVLRVGGGAEKELARLGPGSPLGEMSLFDDSPTSARVAAAETTEVFFLSRQRFEELMRTSDQLAIKIYRVFIQILAERLRKALAKG